MTGTDHGAIDYRWLLANLELGEVAHAVDKKPVGVIETFVLGAKAVHAAESYVLGLFQLYPTVYYHKATRGAEKIFTYLLTRVMRLSIDGSTAAVGLPPNHPIVRFANKPNELENIMLLDDTVIWGALSLMADASDPVVSDFATRLRDRRLYKSVDVRSRLAHRFGEDDNRIDIACAEIAADVSEWVSENSSEWPRILTDEANREPYKNFQQSKGPLNQIRIKTGTGSLVDLGDRSKIVAAIKPFRLFRLYLADADEDASRFIENAIDGANACGRVSENAMCRQLQT
jgi:HD superfamily phosphohydrolase